jgi:MoxR-like ATPase
VANFRREIVLTAKMNAFLAERYTAAIVALEDIHGVAVPALRHRILLNFEGEAESVDSADVVQKIIEAESAAVKSAVA